MPPSDDLPSLKRIIGQYGLTARKSLGQHYLLDTSLCERIAQAAGPMGDADVLEVGPGPGGLTRALLAAGAHRVVAVERDRRCVEALGSLVAAFPERLRVVEANALTVDDGALVEAPAMVVANLPYNIGTALLLKWLEAPGRFRSLTLMFQKEVAARLTASPGTKDYGRLSIRTQWLCETRRLFDVNPKAFTPPPKVVSTVVRLVPRSEPRYPADADALTRVTAAAFGQRRKMLRAALKSLTGEPEALLVAAGVDPTARAETLTIEQFCALARALTALNK
jgi:16S rRNA (adenine1518-N6/adenine1519-N6)-dimethyltransferase